MPKQRIGGFADENSSPGCFSEFIFSRNMFVSLPITVPAGNVLLQVSNSLMFDGWITEKGDSKAGLMSRSVTSSIPKGEA